MQVTGFLHAEMNALNLLYMVHRGMCAQDAKGLLYRLVHGGTCAGHGTTDHPDPVPSLRLGPVTYALADKHKMGAIFGDAMATYLTSRSWHLHQLCYWL